MERYAEEIEKDKLFNKSAKVELDKQKNPITIVVITKEGYIYWITEDKVEYKGKQGELTPPDLQESDIEIKVEPSKWTNTKVEVTIESKIEMEGNELQYSTNGTDWEKYVKAISVYDNGEIYVRLINQIDEVGGYTTANIANIDRLEPNNFTPTATSTSNSITLTGNTTDKAKTTVDGSSGVEKYYFSNDNGATWQPKDGQTGTSYTFNNLTQNQTYNLKMKAVDKAGNEVVTSAIQALLHVHEDACYVHKHTASCYTVHTHTGNSTSGGGCYGTKNVGAQKVTCPTCNGVGAVGANSTVYNVKRSKNGDGQTEYSISRYCRFCNKDTGWSYNEYSVYAYITGSKYPDRARAAVCKFCGGLYRNVW